MRALSILVLLPLLSACEPPPTPEPEPRVTADPVVIKSETERQTMLAGSASRGDFKVNFGEPFIGFENRGERMSIRQNYEGPSYRVIDVKGSPGENAVIFRAQEGAIPGGEPFVLTIERMDCVDQFTGDRTLFTAWLGTASNPKETKGCAARAR
ncbi:hypothetical protein [Qipengyuania vesicularis]|uniref:hypothetical protein n=1 Tax=Qipengyuania vesicularis TaxID=2867232 RepID=UPI001C87A3E3|nr:hypothetical protein [Qipengyuania vesicularis]MBX7528454.1 hypothetical protein [Qipengyuania vesicularis]